MVAVVELATAVVVIVNVALELPAGTVTLAGTLAAVGVLLFSDTAAPPLGAAPVSVTVPWDEDLPRTLVGLKVNVLNAGGMTVSEAVLVIPL